MAMIYGRKAGLLSKGAKDSQFVIAFELEEERSNTLTMHYKNHF